MSTFTDTAKALSQAAEDVRISCLATRTAANELSEIKNEIEKRLEADAARTSEEIAELEQLAADQSRTATARRMSSLKLERLKAYKPSVMPDESATFDEKYAEAGQALTDWRESEKKLRELLSAAKNELEALKPGKLTNGIDPELSRRTIEGCRESFDTMVARNSGQ